MKAFQGSCRGVVGFYAGHLTGKWGGVLVAATTLDGENRLVPLGIGVARSETKENWLIFLKDLAPGILAHHSGKVTFISDQQKGLLEAVAEVFPGMPHRYCWRHNYKNFKKTSKSPTLHSSMWNAAKAYKIKHFEEHMIVMYQENAKVAEYLMKQGHQNWSRAFFDPISCCEHLNNNFSESFNSMATELRDKPIVILGMLYGELVMKMFTKRREQCTKWKSGDLVPKAKDLIKKMLAISEKFHVQASVVGEDYYRTTCAPKVFPLEDISDYPGPPTENKILHPPSQRKPGRPHSKRRRSYDEPQTEKKKRKCTQCGSTEGHNKRTCKGGDVGKNQTRYRPRTECDAINFIFTDTDEAETSTARGKAKKKEPSNTQSFSQAFAGIGYVAQNIVTVTQDKGKQGKKNAKKK
ncbi:uncharacterized protein LOC113272248 [Papaver somniferum]|uniref:uncharacterized protein LOC113272248 n=1 Tax=Papaver somniferum TaxID=3469 RepID=UPI000E702D83|nr:uncharacterized protein LOC113272248 [Papaver somniferum]